MFKNLFHTLNARFEAVFIQYTGEYYLREFLTNHQLMTTEES